MLVKTIVALLAEPAQRLMKNDFKTFTEFTF